MEVSSVREVSRQEVQDLMRQGACDLSDIEIAVLDEADHMADMGFMPDVERLLSLLSVRRVVAAVLDPNPAAGGGAHAAVPVSSASMIIFSSATICHAISFAVRDFGSGR